jgi:hypothetical protein
MVHKGCFLRFGTEPCPPLRILIFARKAPPAYINPHPPPAPQKNSRLPLLPPSSSPHATQAQPPTYDSHQQLPTSLLLHGLCPPPSVRRCHHQPTTCMPPPASSMSSDTLPWAI